MWIISILVITIVGYVISGRELPITIQKSLANSPLEEAVLEPNQIALPFIVGLFLASTPLHVLIRYTATLIHELGHAFTAGLLGGRPKNIHIHPSASGVASYQPPMSWGRVRASTVSFCGYPAPCLAALAACQAVLMNHGVVWFTFSTAVLLIAILLLLRNIWGFMWSIGMSGLCIALLRLVEPEWIAMIVMVLAGYMAMEGVRHAWEQRVIVQKVVGSGCDADSIARRWNTSPKLIGSVHLLIALVVGAVTAHKAVSPYWTELTHWFSDFLRT